MGLWNVAKTGGIRQRFWRGSTNYGHVGVNLQIRANEEWIAQNTALSQMDNIFFFRSLQFLFRWKQKIRKNRIGNL